MRWDFAYRKSTLEEYDIDTDKDPKGIKELTGEGTAHEFAPLFRLSSTFKKKMKLSFTTNYSTEKTTDSGIHAKTDNISHNLTYGFTFQNLRFVKFSKPVDYDITLIYSHKK